MLAADEVLVADEIGGVEGGSELIEKCGKSSKTGKLFKSRKLFKSGKSKAKKSAKSKNSSKIGNSPNFDATKAGPSFLTPKARAAFNRLRLAFTKAPILQHFGPEYHIRIKIDASGYAISGMLNQLASGTSPNGIITKANLGQWHPVAFFSGKVILAETRYKTYNSKLLAIFEAFKTWRH